MTGRRSIERRIAAGLIAHAAKRLPDDRSVWATAMANEFEHLPDDQSALGWSIGCLFSSYRERIRVMNNQSPLSGWILGLEMLICFVPMTLFGLAVIPALATGSMPIADAMIFCLVAAIGPMGLIVAFRTLVLRRPTSSKLILAAICFFALLPILAFESQQTSAAMGDSWREFLLLAVLPAAGWAHLVYISRCSAQGLTAS